MERAKAKKYSDGKNVVEALQNPGGVLAWFDVDEFVGQKVIFPYIMNPGPEGADTIHLYKPDGTLWAVGKGDWIIKTADGVIYPLTPESFGEIYKEVKDGSEV